MTLHCYLLEVETKELQQPELQNFFKKMNQRIFQTVFT